jgi:flagellin FlaB
MIASKRNDEGFTGLEAAIVLIAFVVVAAVFSYVVLGAGFFTTQKAQETVYKGVEQSTANIQMIGNVYGIASVPASGIDEIKFSIGLAPGAPAIDLTKMKIVFSTPTTSPIILAQNNSVASSNTTFTTKLNGATNVSSMSANDQVEIDFDTAFVPANTKMTIELRPSVGAALPFSKTAPATITATNVLY